MNEETQEDVKTEVTESSTETQEGIPGWDADLDEQDANPETESEETQEEGSADDEEQPEVQAEQEAKPERKVPLPSLIKERKKRQELERELSELKNHAQTNDTTEPKSQTVSRPKLKDFEYNEEAHEKALEEWEDERLNVKVRELQETRDAQRKAQEEDSKKKELESQWENFVEKDPEYAELVQEVSESGEDVNLPPVVVQAIQECGFELDKHILKNRDVLIPKLRSMTPLQQSIEVGRILSVIENPNKPKPKPKSNAPKPIETVTPTKVVEEAVPSGWVLA